MCLSRMEISGDASALFNLLICALLATGATLNDLAKVVGSQGIKVLT
jgi:hypothetical protein